MIKKLALSVIALVATVPSIFAAFPVVEPFADATGSGGTSYALSSVLAGQVNAQGYTWFTVNTGGSGTTPTNTAGNLAYAGLPASSGNSITVLNVSSGKGARLSLQTNVTTGTFYASFLMKITSLSGLTTTPVFWACFNNSTADTSTALTVGGAKVFLKSTTGGYLIGFSKNSTTVADLSFDTTVHTLNETVFVVVRYSSGTAATASDCKIWINPASGTFGNAVEPAFTTNSSTASGQTDPGNIASWTFLQRSSTQPASTIVDELRVGRTWAGVTGGPEIGFQPASRTNNAGTTATFTVNAGGAAPLSYSWVKNGTTTLVDGGNISGATTATLTLTGVLAADAGTYTCVVANSYGSVTSSGAILTVKDPVITSQPANLTLPPGATANYSVVASGTPTLTYLWYSNAVAMADGITGSGSTVSGSATANLSISGITTGDAATYTCAVTNGLGSGLLSSGGTLTILDPAITSSPQNVTNNFGGSAVFNVTAAGTGPFTYGWQFNGVTLSNGGNVSGSSTATLTLNPISYLDAGNYAAVVTNNLGNSVTSSPAILVVKDPVITSQPVATTNVAGTTATFSVTAAGSATVNYQWKRGGTNMVNAGNVSGATSSTLTLTGVSQADATSYTVVVSGSASLQTVTSSAATLKVLDPPVITIPPASRTVQAGVNVTFVTVATGTAPLSYQWSVNGSPISGATTTSYIVSSVAAGSQTVSVTVSNSASSASASATLTATAASLSLYDTNLVVLRAGEGSQVLSANGNSIFMDQFTPSGTYVNTVTIPDTGATPMLQGGVTTAEGYMTRSADGKLLCFVGYDTNITAGVALGTASAAAVPRVIGTLDGSSTFNRPVKTTTKYSGSAFRCAVTDGANNFWGAGGAGGTVYFPGSGTPVDIQTTKVNTRVVEIFNGNLYLGTASTAGTPATQGIFQFSGEPFTAQALSPAIISTNTGSGDGMNDFSINPAGTTLYFADDRSLAGIAGGVQRWDFDGASTWTNTYNLTNGLGTTTTRSLTVDWSGPKPVIYATTSQTSQNKLVVVTDNGSSSPFTTIATAGPNQLFRGLKFGPAAVVLNPPTMTSTVRSGSNLSISGTNGAPLGTYHVVTSTDLTIPMASWTSIGTGSFAGDGSFSFPTPVNFGQPALFYRIQVP
jgi:hypothetical protein